MGKAYTTRSFKSGNSVAIRMPAGLGVEPDREWTAEWVDGELRLRAKPAEKQKLDVDRFWGKARGMVHVPVPREDFEPRPSSLKPRP